MGENLSLPHHPKASISYSTPDSRYLAIHRYPNLEISLPERKGNGKKKRES
jgi:hypothetical protein